MKTEFEYNDKIIATADLEELLCEDSTVTIFGKKYIVFENYHKVEIDENGTHEKVVCTVVTEEEYEDKKNIYLGINQLAKYLLLV